MSRALIALSLLLLVALPGPAAAKTLTVGVKVAPPFVIQNDDGKFTGISIDLWQRIADDLNLKFRYRLTDLQGLFDGLRNGKLDVAVGALTMTAAREKIIDFTHPFYNSGLAVAVRPQGSPWWAALKRLFSYQFFVAVAGLFALLFMVGFAVWLFERRRNPDEFGGPAAHGLASGLWWAAVTMTTVGYGDKAPRTVGGRIIGLIWMFAAIILISGFTAAIATSLTVGQLGNSVHNVDDLRQVQVATVPDATAGDALHARGIAFTPAKSAEKALQELANRRTDAVVYDAPILQYLANNEYPKRTQVLPFRFEPQEYALALPAGSPLREKINERILQIVNGPAWAKVLGHYLGSAP